MERHRLTSFETLGLAEPLLRALSAEGFTTPTPIQSKAIPVLCEGRDVVGIAQTGTGKTAAFVVPLLDRLARGGERAASKQCGALILTPTRELAAQIVDNIRQLSGKTKVSVALVVGGVKPNPQIRALARGADILVATPGRLLDHMETGAVNLVRTRVVVLDEADQMLDLGFMPAIRQIMGRLPKRRQTALFSATMPTQIRRLAGDFLDNPEEVAVAAVARPIERIAQSVRHVPAGEKRQALTRILSDVPDARAIVFTRTKRGADRVNRHLQQAGLSADALHGNKSQSQREKILSGFRSGRTSILVATDIAARGIDIDDISHVVNFELPNVAEAYVHRIGRTARAGRDGIAISLCDPAERPLLRDIEKLIGNRLTGEAGSIEAEESKEAPAADASPGAANADKPANGARSGRRRRRGGRNGRAAKSAGQASGASNGGAQNGAAQNGGAQNGAVQYGAAKADGGNANGNGNANANGNAKAAKKRRASGKRNDAAPSRDGGEARPRRPRNDGPTSGLERMLGKATPGPQHRAQP